MNIFTAIEETFNIVGDEDGDVSINCRSCEELGLPVVFYTTDKRITGYSDSECIIVYNIHDLFEKSFQHLRTHIPMIQLL